MTSMSTPEIAYLLGKHIAQVRENDDLFDLSDQGVGNSMYLAWVLLDALDDLKDNLGNAKEKPEVYQELCAKIDAATACAYKFMKK